MDVYDCKVDYFFDRVWTSGIVLRILSCMNRKRGSQGTVVDSVSYGFQTLLRDCIFCLTVFLLSFFPLKRTSSSFGFDCLTLEVGVYYTFL